MISWVGGFSSETGTAVKQNASAGAARSNLAALSGQVFCESRAKQRPRCRKQAQHRQHDATKTIDKREIDGVPQECPFSRRDRLGKINAGQENALRVERLPERRRDVDIRQATSSD